MPTPVAFDFLDLRDAVLRNNVGVDAMFVTVHAHGAGHEIVFTPTDQRFPRVGDPPAADGLHRFEVVGIDTDGPIALRFRGH